MPPGQALSTGKTLTECAAITCQINASGVSIRLVEQNVAIARRILHRTARACSSMGVPSPKAYWMFYEAAGDPAGLLNI